MSKYDPHAFNVYSVQKETVVVKWYDQNRRPQRKEYTDWKEARKAVQWLVEAGVDGVDFAIPAEVMYSNKSE